MRSPSTGRRIHVGPAARFLESGERTVTEADGHEILVLAVNGTIYAVGNRCTHRPFWLDEGRALPATHEIVCPLHLGRFSLRTGEATAPPCWRPIPTYRISLIDDQVYVELPSGTD